MSKEPMTYRQIKEYVDTHDLEPMDWEDVPWGVRRWLTHEMLPAIRRTRHYEWPENLDLICPHTNPLKTGRYVTDPA